MLEIRRAQPADTDVRRPPPESESGTGNIVIAVSSKTTTWYFYLNSFAVLQVSIPHKETNIYTILLAQIDKAFFDRILLLLSSPSKPALADKEESRDCRKKAWLYQLIFCQCTNDTANKCNKLRDPTIRDFKTQAALCSLPICSWLCEPGRP